MSGPAQEIRWDIWIRDMDALLADYDAQDARGVLTAHQHGERTMLVTVLSEVKEIRATQEFDPQGLIPRGDPVGLK